MVAHDWRDDYVKMQILVFMCSECDDVGVDTAEAPDSKSWLKSLLWIAPRPRPQFPVT